MRRTAVTDLEELLKRHLPRDTSEAMTDYVRESWLRVLPAAQVVVVEWVDDPSPQLTASWLNDRGEVIASISSPPSQAESVREFVRDWESFRYRHGLDARVEWETERDLEAESPDGHPRL
jgi:hypothetical protein